MFLHTFVQGTKYQIFKISKAVISDVKPQEGLFFSDQSHKTVINLFPVSIKQSEVCNT
jgi:hypothetical protein